MRGAMLLWDLGSVTRTDYDEDGFITVQLDWYGDDSHAEPATLHHTHGFISRPMAGNTNDSQTCTVLRFDTDNDRHAIALADCRTVPDLEELEEGASMMYATTKGHFVLVDSNGIKGYVGEGKKIMMGGDDARDLALAEETVAIFNALSTLVSAIGGAVPAAATACTQFIQVLTAQLETIRTKKLMGI